MILKIYEDNPSEEKLEQVVSILKKGGLIIYPTDSVYAMGCNALNERAVEQICRIKQDNPKKNNLSIICSDLSQASHFAKIDNQNFSLIKRLTPGPFTFILPTTNSLPKIFKNKKTVGIRIPDNKIPREIAEMLGNPILTTSLKNEELEYLTDPELIDEQWSSQVDLIIDGGYGAVNPSTIIDCCGDEPELIRQGAGTLPL